MMSPIASLSAASPVHSTDSGWTRFAHDIGRAYTRRIVDEGKEEAFWVLIAFIITFVIVRLITHAIRAGAGPVSNVKIRGVHLHHLVPGIILLIVTGYLANALHVRTGRTIVAIFFGIGAALTLDEFALWLHLEDVYWAKRGRLSIDAIIIAICLGGLILLHFSFWHDVGKAIGRVL
jgi:hypothetical protein